MGLFFDQFQAFIGQLIVVFPDDKDFPVYLSNLKIAKLTNPKMVIAGLEQHCVPFANMIKARNADFFLKYPFAEYEKDETIIPVIRKMKDMWLQISPVNQGHIMDYVNNLLTLVTRYLELSGSLLK
jgi:hypothetical protein